MRQRWNGSIQSSNTPTYDKNGIFREDFNLYRCMVTKVFYTDDPNNITKNARNPSTIYEVVILGGAATGQTLFPCRPASWLGGNNNYSERTLTASSKDISDTKLSDCDGDIVYVQFNQGHDAYPVIIACDKGLNDTVSGTSSVDGPRSISQYNGINELIDNQGGYTLTRKGGTLDNGVFTPGTSLQAQFKMVDDLIQLLNGSGAFFKMLQNEDIVQFSTEGGAGVKATEALIAIGTQSVELLQQISDTLLKLKTFFINIDATHDHIGNLGYPSSPPETATDFVQVGDDLNTIKGKVDSIKGTF